MRSDSPQNRPCLLTPVHTLIPDIHDTLITTLSCPVSQEDLLCYVSQYHTRLDAINLVTSVYRLAKMFGHIRIPEHRAVWKQELIRSHTFIVLLSRWPADCICGCAFLVPDKCCRLTSLDMKVCAL